jgi:hypothetical protein
MRRPLIVGCSLAVLIGLILFGAAIRNLTTPRPVAATSAPRAEPTGSFSGEFRTLTARQWLKIAKNPDAHLGEAIVVFGKVTQFDTVTGLDTFRARVGARRSSYPTPAVLTGDAEGLADLLQADEFQANVIVTGSIRDKPMLEGGATIPRLQIRTLQML